MKGNRYVVDRESHFIVARELITEALEIIGDMDYMEERTDEDLTPAALGYLKSAISEILFFCGDHGISADFDEYRDKFDDFFSRFDVTEPDD